MEYGLVAVWLVTYLVVLFAGMPLAAVLFPRLGDRGAGVALPLALAVFWIGAYVAGQVSTAASLVVGLVALIGLVTLAGWRGAAFDRRRYAEIAGVFALAFLFMVVLRAVDPAIHPYGGEKFLDFGLLQATLRAEALPPEDMWYAGEPVMYYYGGHFLTAQLARLTGTAPAYAYNLGLAGFFATFVTAAYGLAGSIAGRRGGFDRVGAGLGAFFVGLASNLTTALGLVALALPGGLGEWFGRTLQVWTGRFDGPTIAQGVGEFGAWDATGIIDGTINEFPLFAWLNGDLHGHMMVQAFLLLAVALLVSYYRTPAGDLRRRRLLVFGAVSVLSGVVAVVHTWTFPTIGGLVFLALALAPADPGTLFPRRLRAGAPVGGLPAELRRLGAALVGAVLTLAVGLLLTIRYWSLLGGGKSPGVWTEPSAAGALLAVHGAFLLAFVAFLAWRGWDRFRPSRARVAAVALGLAALLVVAELLSVAVLAIAPPLVAGAWLLHRADALGLPDARPPVAGDGGGADSAKRFSPGFETVLLVGGAGIVFIVEFFFLVERAGPGRMNTVFKTYADVWALWSVGAAACLALLRRAPGPSLPTPRFRTVATGVAALLVLSTSVWGALAVGGHVLEPGPLQTVDDPTLDGLAYVEKRHSGEAPAIEWLAAREGSPTVVAKPGLGIYSWTSAPSSLTGVPTVIGWVHHERGFGRERARERADDVRQIYLGNASTRRTLLARYDAAYVYVGPAERETYGDPAFDRLRGVSVAEAWDAVTIYRVDQAALSG